MEEKTNKEKVLDFLLENPGEQYYLTQIAEAVGTAVATTQHILEKQIEEDFVTKQKLGNLSFYRVDGENPLVKQAKKMKTIREIASLIKKLRDYSQKIILFGSCSRGEDTAESDIDLFVLSREKEVVRDKIANFKSKKRIGAIVRNYIEWVEMKEEDRLLWQEINRGEILWEEKSE